MALNSSTQSTQFSRDILGRYVCNTLDEALRSTDSATRPDARPFDLIVIGAGTVGAAVAQHLFARDIAHSHRILVLEAGPFLLPEHLQNMPLLGLNIYGPEATTIQALRDAGEYGPDKPRDEVWGLSWHSETPFPGIAYCIGGRSLVWGGWSPQLLESEYEVAAAKGHPWPAAVVDDLKARYLKEAAEQLGVNETNDFIHGELHTALRQKLYEGIKAGAISDILPWQDWPLQLDNVDAAERDLYKLEAPQAVQTETRAGFFPVNKFSSVPLLMRAARQAFVESNMDDVKKRLMVVPNCHVQRLRTERDGDGRRVTGVETNQGFVPLPDNGRVILSLGTIETTRLAQVSFPDVPNADLMGQNFTGHLISILLVRLPREAFDIDETVRELQASALIARGRHTHDDGSHGHFHLQITGSGLGPYDLNAEQELYQKIPDLDSMAAFRHADDTHVVLVILGVGEMELHNPASQIRLDPEADEFGVQRAFVSIEATQKDMALWDAMDTAADEVAKALAGDKPFEVLSFVTGLHQVQPDETPADYVPFIYRRFGLGESHHEAGSLWMGDDPEKSVTDADGRFHYVRNAYVAGPANFTSNAAPVLTGIALGRRLGDHLVPIPEPYTGNGNSIALFDGIFPAAWQMLGEGDMIVVDGTLETVPGSDLGLYWCAIPLPPNFALSLQWLRWHHDANSGIYLRFPNPYTKGYRNPAYVPVDFGMEVQIDELQSDERRTGALYNVPGQVLELRSANPAGEWNQFYIQVKGQEVTVQLNGQTVSWLKHADPVRFPPGSQTSPVYMGLQVYPGSRVAFRELTLRPLRG